MQQQENREKTSILAQSPTMFERLGRHRKAAIGFGGTALLSMVAAFGLPTPSAQDPGLSRQTLLENLTLKLEGPVEIGPHAFLKEERVQRGDTVASLLNRLGIDDQAALDFIRQTPATQVIFRQLAPGKLVTARTTEDGGLLSLHYPLNGKDTLLVVEKSSNSFRVAEQAPEIQVHTEMKSGEIRNSLFGATDAAGVPDAIATQLADIFGGDIDFHRDLRKGDRFTLVYEMYYSHGQSMRSGKILSAEFINDGRNYRAVFFQDSRSPESKGSYYTPEGKSLRKAFLRSPLEFSRVTSGFTNARFHPVLREWRAHKGVDYGAPTGTRVRATADGSVEFSGKRNGYGNLVILRHDGRHSTAYGHLNAFAPGVRQGARVSQGDIIGYVGATGWATGPHLHYEFRIGGEPVNPLATSLPIAQPLSSAQLGRFRQQTAPNLERLDMLGQSNLSAMAE